MMSRVLAKSAEHRVFTGWHMLALLVGFFGVVIAVNVTLAVSSATSWPGLTVENSYVASQEFQDRLDAARAQHALGWTSRFTYVGGIAHFEIDDGAGKPLELGTVTLAVNRPVGTHGEQVLELARIADGTYSAELDLAPGTWDAVITAPDTGHGPFELRRRFSVK